MSKKNIFIIAEAGVNHNGSLKIAKKLIKVASNAGANAIKFQTFKAKNITSKYSIKAKYQKINDRKNINQLEMLKKLEMSKKMHLECIRECKKRNIKFMSSCFDLEGASFLKKLRVDVFKIPSGEINNLLLLKLVGSFKKKVILSTGMSNLNEIRKAINILVKSGTKKNNITVLHCNTEYPSPFKDLNLNAINFLKEKLKISIGYSDHSLGVEVPIAVAALGSTVIEKHFTLSRKLKGPDHTCSLEPNELSFMIKSIRNVENALGVKKKLITNSEKKNLRIVRKSICAKTKIKKGEKFSLNNLITLRPGNGISPMRILTIIGKKSKYNFKENQQIKL